MEIIIVPYWMLYFDLCFKIDVIVWKSVEATK